MLQFRWKKNLNIFKVNRWCGVCVVKVDRVNKNVNFVYKF